MILPVLFIGHGSPMNIIAKNKFTEALAKLGRQLPKPKAILCVSAHWQTPQTQILISSQPKTIYDFTGFPKELYEVSYPAAGAPLVAEQVAKLTGAVKTEAWGLDHGAWSVLVHLFPQADIPTTQLSLGRNLSMQQHFDFAQKLAPLREEGVLILGSGNIVHNLRQIEWDERAPAYGWANEFDENVKHALLKKDFQSLVDFQTQWSDLAPIAHPTIEHYLPLIYAIGAAGADSKISFPYEEIQNASISMRSVQFN